MSIFRYHITPLLSSFLLGYLFCGTTLVTPLFSQVEICDNGIDDDGDQLIDINDDDCYCLTVSPVSLIPNPSFEEMNCCPQDRSSLDCATSWIQASEATTDYLHTCGWMGWDDFPPPLPFPDGEGIMGFRDGRVRSSSGEAQVNWKEYAGACLDQPLEKDTTYRIQFDLGFLDRQKSPPINISFFGTADCSNLPFGLGNDQFGCPTNSTEWIRLGDVFVSGADDTWVSAFIETTPPFDIEAIAIGPDCPGVDSPISIYYFFDNLILANFESFKLKISETQHPCNTAYGLSVPEILDIDYQWYKDGVAIIGENSHELSQASGEGIYQVRIDDGASCRLSAEFEHVIPVIENVVTVSICQDEQYRFGDLVLTEPGMYRGNFSSVDNCDSIVSLELEVIGFDYDTLEVGILSGETYEIEGNSFSEEGEYPLTLISDQGCERLLLVKLSHFNIYFPNVITPNSDGVNAAFAQLAKDGNIKEVELYIYDRWGGLVYQGDSWDGRLSNGLVEPGSYVYVAETSFENTPDKLFSGTLLVVR